MPVTGPGATCLLTEWLKSEVLNNSFLGNEMNPSYYLVPGDGIGACLLDISLINFF